MKEKDLEELLDTVAKVGEAAGSMVKHWTT
jgi:hypothetical protein